MYKRQNPSFGLNIVHGRDFFPIFPQHQRYTLPRVGWSVGKTVHVVKAPISDRSNVLSSLFLKSYSVYRFSKTWKSRPSFAGCCGSHPTILTSVLGSCCVFCLFSLVSKRRRYGQKARSWRSFGLTFNVITNRTKLKNNTANALCSLFALVCVLFWFWRTRNTWDVHHFAENDWILTDFDRFLPILDFVFLVDSPVTWN